ncbi:flagellar basal body rod protein FlgB [Myxococcota bacterium]|nr:flagellar basal body rod protein FlgB [Myxococcota bacterium]MBU1429658.1 flagellar basal body rod protein FlgB [Myxococcota bacterium]MBU1898119.1 flagellar basal body rod protein FlgB [Myxococcota bacterium]
MNLLFDRLSATLAHGLDLRLERANLIHANIANLDTPGYTPVEMQFERQLQVFLESPHARANEGDEIQAPKVEYDFYALPDMDGNSVDLDHEMSKLSENQLLYRATTKAYNKRMAILKYAVTEGQG